MQLLKVCFLSIFDHLNNFKKKPIQTAKNLQFTQIKCISCFVCQYVWHHIVELNIVQSMQPVQKYKAVAEIAEFHPVITEIISVALCNFLSF